MYIEDVWQKVRSINYCKTNILIIQYKKNFYNSLKILNFQKTQKIIKISYDKKEHMIRLYKYCFICKSYYMNKKPYEKINIYYSYHMKIFSLLERSLKAKTNTLLKGFYKLNGFFLLLLWCALPLLKGFRLLYTREYKKFIYSSSHIGDYKKNVL